MTNPSDGPSLAARAEAEFGGAGPSAPGVGAQGGAGAKTIDSPEGNGTPSDRGGGNSPPGAKPSKESSAGYSTTVTPDGALPKPGKAAKKYAVSDKTKEPSKACIIL